MAVICRDAGILFLLAPRTASTAVARVLIDELHGEWIPDSDLFDGDRLVAPEKHTTAAQLMAAGLLTPPELDRLHVFTAVRNPFDSLVSLYHKQRHEYADLGERSFVHTTAKARFAEEMRAAAAMSFNGWVRFKLDPPLAKRSPVRVAKRFARRVLLDWRRTGTMYGPFYEAADTVLRFESLQDDLARMLSTRGLPPIVVPQHNRTESREGRHYRQFYDRRSRRLVTRAYRLDLERFDYEF